MVISSNVLKDTKKTVTITQEVGTRDISSGLEKLKSLQKKITDNPELLSEFISENLDRIYNFEDLKSRREKYNNSVIANDKSYYGINTAPIVDFFVKNIDIAVKVSDLLKKGELPIVVDREKTRFNICLVEGSYHKNQYSATITDLHLTNSESYNDFLALIGEKNIVVESLISTLNNNLKTLTSDLLTNEFSLENVLNKEIPLSILSDYQINKSLQDKQDINIYKLTLLRESSSSPEQFSRFMNILEKFIQDKFLE